MQNPTLNCSLLTLIIKCVHFIKIFTNRNQCSPIFAASCSTFRLTSQKMSYSEQKFVTNCRACSVKIVRNVLSSSAWGGFRFQYYSCSFGSIRSAFGINGRIFMQPIKENTPFCCLSFVKQRVVRRLIVCALTHIALAWAFMKIL